MEEQLLSKGPFHVDTFLLCLLIFEKKDFSATELCQKSGAPRVERVVPNQRSCGATSRPAHLSTGKGRGFSLPG
jgi:hypothetical protein